jgi:hypothetical protein
MKKLILAFFITLNFNAIAQYSEIQIVAENNAPFYISINGVQQNTQPLNHIVLNGLQNSQYSLFIDYISPNIPDVNTTIYLTYNNQPAVGQYSYIIPTYYQNGLHLKQFTPFQNGYQSNSTQTIITQTTTTNSHHPNNDNVSINMNLGIGGNNMSVNINDGGSHHQTQTTTTQTTIVNNNINTNHVNQNHAIINHNTCMPRHDFNNAKNSISSKTFEDSKLKIAKQITKSNKLSSKQIKEIMMIFDYEDTKLTFAKYAYTYCCDPNNYYQVNDAFEFEFSIEELEEHIN